MAHVSVYLTVTFLLYIVVYYFEGSKGKQLYQQKGKTYPNQPFSNVFFILIATLLCFNTIDVIMTGAAVSPFLLCSLVVNPVLSLIAVYNNRVDIYKLYNEIS